MNSLLKGALLAAGIGLGGVLLGQAILRRSRWFSFRGQTVLVTGGSRGLGLQIARELVDAGARVVICARTASQLQAAEQELRGRGGDVMSFRCDVREPAQVQSVVQQILDRWGVIHVLVNVAGVIEVGPLDAMTMEDFHDAMDTHCWGVLHAVLAVLPSMRQRGWGRIVNVASIGGKTPVPHLLPYVASKFALVGLSTGLRTELAREGILVTTVSPGLMRTGSPRNAIFKGQHRKEYAWFSISDALPMLSTDAPSATRKILRGCQNGDSEVLITAPATLAAWLEGLAPNLTAELASLVDLLLPEMGGIGRRAARGYESESDLSPSWLTTLSDRAVLENNEVTSDQTE